MRTQRVLRLAVIAFCILMGALVAVAFAEHNTLAETRQEAAIPALPFLFGTLALLGVLVGCVAILTFRKWGAWLHLVSTAVGTCAAAFAGHQVVSATSGVVDSLLMIATGLIYGLAFFTDALAHDDERPNKAPEPTPLAVMPAAEQPSRRP